MPRQRIVAEAAQHAARGQIHVRLVHAPRGHAVMRRLYDHADALRLEDLVDRFGNLGGHLLLNLQPLGINLNDACELADADHAAPDHDSWVRPSAVVRTD